MPSLRKPLSRRIADENYNYRRWYERSLQHFDLCSIVDLRQALARCPTTAGAGAPYEALVTKLIFRGAAPRLVGSDGRVWA